MIGLQELLVILVIVAVLFGGSQIPKLARALGRARKDFEAGYRDGQEVTDQKEKTPNETESGKDPAP